MFKRRTDRVRKMKKKKSNSGEASVLVVTMIVVAVLGVGWMIAPDGVKHEIKETVKNMFPGGETKPPPPPEIKVPEAELREDLRQIWTFAQNFAISNKRLPVSVEEMGNGVGIDNDGYVLNRRIWEAGTGIKPAQFDRCDGEAIKDGEIMTGYNYRIIPVLDAAGKTNTLKITLAAYPEKANDDNRAIVAVCGPVELANVFSFKLNWPVYTMEANKDVMNFLQHEDAVTDARLQEEFKSFTGILGGSVKGNDLGFRK